MSARVVVGLGNPGPRYAGSRHNVGFDAVDRLAGPAGFASKARFDHAGVTIRSRVVVLVKPTTFMNDSGLAVREAMTALDLDVESLLVLVDDIHLDVGRTRVRRGGSDGGHNGMRSIVDTIGSDAFVRIRMGVGAVPQGMSQIDHVLGKFDASEVQRVDGMVARAAEAVRTWCADGVEVAMNLFNGR